ncbi:peptidase domain-containing ABC transporter [Streptacidiphilus sp. PB12-B1b]|uniref:peptidase domain-containing ABC transporter n=1 Tax=Streptacidiphilus sp. PB12-B1b TaxID=2705012 RepID=UPI0015FB360D|nr:peptidase domain-containing ABC transporter [Streptacidiphilus sp. PB12-B1b]QMU78264.1 peptidase domain-containing ABC transporter [Streptacidiphilus sp. PB12-B1b]
MSDDEAPRGEYGPADRRSGGPGRFRRKALSARGASREYGPAVGSGRLIRLSHRSGSGRTGATARRWQRRSRQRVPVRLQAQTSDCGAASLAMVLAFHGLDVPIKDLRRATQTGRDGVSARQLLEAARTYGFNARGIRSTLDGLRDLPPATVLFWDFTHFVVLEQVKGRWVHIVDPRLGRRRVALEAAGEAFTGVALQITPGLRAPADRSPRPVVSQQGAVSPWRYLRRFFPSGRRWTPFVLCSLLLLGFNLAMPLSTQYVVDHVAAGRRTAGAPALCLAVTALAAAFFALQFIRSLSVLAIQATVDESVTLGILNRLFSLPHEYFASRSPGELVQRVRTSTAIRQVISVSALSSVFDGILILFYMALLLLADPTLALLVIVLALLQVGLLLVSWRKHQYASADAVEARTRAGAELAEILEGMTTLKAAGVEGPAGRRWSHSLADELNTRLRSRRLLTVSSTLSSALQLAAPLVVLLVGSLRVASGALSLGEVLGFSVLAMGLLVPVANLVQIGLEVSGLRAELARLGDIIEATPEKRAGDRAISVHGALEVDDVSFAYGAGGTRVLSEVSFSVPQGTFTALLGGSGSGKSSCALLLAGLHSPTAGSVRVDGHDLEDVDTSGYRQSISFINQDSRLFSGSIQENIAFGGPDVSEAEVIEAGRLACIHDDVTRMPMGYATLLGSGGGGVSGGQRQRIILARALVRRPKILIMDEATSALDPVLEARIFELISGLGMTLIVVAHRLTAVRSADQVVVLDSGRMVQCGAPQELSRAAGPYRTLVAPGPADLVG